MSEKPKSDKAIQQEAFLDKLREIGRQNLPDNEVFVSGKDLLGAATLFDVKIREDIQTTLIETLAEKNVSVRVEAEELASLNKQRLKSWIYDWIMDTGVMLMVLKDHSLLDKTPIKIKEENPGDISFN